MRSTPSFEELFDLNEIQTIQDSFTKATGIASFITDPDGRPITKPSNFCTLCNIIRKTEKGLSHCRKSDSVIGRYNPDGPVIQVCLSGGLMDAGASINVGGKHIASWLIGQVKNEKTDIKKMMEYAAIIGADKNEFAKALDKVTYIPLDQFQHISNYLFLMANQLSKQAYQKLKEREIASDLKKSKNELIKKTEYMEALHETALGMFSRLDLSKVLEAIIVRASNLTEIPDGFIHIHNPEHNTLEIKAACGKYLPLKGINFTVGEGISGKVWETGESLIIDDYQKWSGKTLKSEFDFIRSALGVPLTSGSKIEGVLGLSHHKKEHFIPLETILILEQFAELATIAIDNAKLFESMKNELDKRIELENEREKMESRIRQSQKIEAIGTLSGGIAHDFNNILFPVIGFSEMIMEDLPENSPIKDQMRTVLNGALRAKDLVQQILTFSRQTDQAYKPLKIQLLLKEILNLIRASLPATIKIIKNIPGEIGMVIADPTQIHQVVMNLIINASHSMEETGGELSVTLSEIDVTNDNLPMFEIAPGSYVCMEITDTGSGMDQNTLDRIFDPYFTTKPKGKATGLGLSVVHGIVKNLHGDIVVKSEVGKGTTCFVYLPRIISQRTGYGMEKISSSEFYGKERILLIDDEKPILKMVEQVISRFGYKVTCHHNGLNALKLFQDSPDQFDLVITDMTMPDITGDKIFKAIKKIRPDLPVILCTGFSEKIAIKRVNERMPDKILMKPVGKYDLLKSIREVLGN